MSFEPALDEVMALHPGAKTLVFLALFLAEPLDLHEVGGELFGQRAYTPLWRGRMGRAEEGQGPLRPVRLVITKRLLLIHNS